MTTKQAAQAATLERRVRQFYELVNKGAFEKCYRMIDPAVREDPNTVTLLQYQQSLEAFRNHFGRVDVHDVRLQVHFGEPSRLYRNLDFAVGRTAWSDEAGEQREFQERWVRVGRLWYTRSTGFVTPSAKCLLPPALDG